MQLAIRQPVPEGTTFAPGTFDRNVGQRYDTGTLVATEVAEDGRSVLLTFEVEAETDQNGNQIGTFKFYEPLV